MSTKESSEKVVAKEDSKSNRTYKLTVGGVQETGTYSSLQGVLDGLRQYRYFMGTNQISQIKKDGVALKSFEDIENAPGIYTMTVQVVPNGCPTTEVEITVSD
jgi:hypothetical protein